MTRVIHLTNIISAKWGNSNITHKIGLIFDLFFIWMDQKGTTWARNRSFLGIDLIIHVKLK